jgi:predicted  nucleic acid-binding Zn-ribbon protein
VRLDKAYAEKDKLEAKLEYSQSELGKSKAEVDKVHGDSSNRYNDYNEWRQKLTKAELEIDRLRYVNNDTCVCAWGMSNVMTCYGRS